jgi:hypothetical protein
MVVLLGLSTIGGEAVIARNRNREAEGRRRRARYRILCDSGVPWRDARAKCQCAPRFAAALALMGVDADEVDPDGELRRRRASGRPRLCTPQSEAKAARYHALRRAGLDAIEANAGAQTPNSFGVWRRRLALRGVRVEAPDDADLLSEQSRALTNNPQERH